MNNTTIPPFWKRDWKIPHSDTILRVINTFSLTEKFIFFFFVTLLFISSISLLWQVNKSFLVDVPDYGGSFSEGVIGSPRFINPLLAVSDIDRDLSALIYSGLLRVDADGALVPDLAKSYTITDDGRSYTFILRDDIVFHDNTKVTADDVIFTIERAKDPALKSPRKANWDGVSVSKLDDKTIEFTLRQPYSPFIQNLTLGILPKHIWKAATADDFAFSQYNVKPVGSGPYMLDTISYTDSGIPSQYTLVSFKKYALGRPYIESIVVKSYSNEKNIIDAFKSGDIESFHSVTPQETTSISQDTSTTMIAPLPRVFGVFFNQSVAPVLVNKEVRQALDIATNKREIIDSVLGGHGQMIDGPIPPRLINEISHEPFGEGDIEKAKSLLIKNGWKQNEDGIFEKTSKKETQTLSFSISTAAVPELKSTALLLQKQWQKIGAEVEVKIFEVSDINQNIIRPRKYDALLFGEIIGRDLDLYPFWHSSGRIDPGLNIALYTNLKADKILETLRKTTDTDSQEKLYNDFNSEIKNDIPAVFIYSPYFTYIAPRKIHNVRLGQLTTPAERFADIYAWYIETNSVWKIFARNK